MAAIFLTTLLWALGLVVLVVSFLPMWNTNLWWVRVMEFPRLQIAIVGVVILLAALFLSGASRFLLPAMMVVACGYQAWRIFPYTTFSPVEMKLAAPAPDAIRVLSSNVLMENTRHDLLRDAIESFDPDILLLMETDQTWIDALEPVLARYSTVIREPKSNHYGMVFATRLAVDEARFVRLTTSETPSVFAQLKGPGETRFRFVGLHPRPPVPGESTTERDAQIYYAARFAAKTGLPLIVTGDFNDVAWSDTSQSFKHVGRYLDPRIGRGFFASFDAEKPYLRFPIDQFYVTPDVAVISIQRLDYVGSDHFPMAATIRLDADLASALNITPKPVSEDERELIEASVERTRKALGHDRDFTTSP
jgi:endonuclease/exonuclease/phosphatase (EEP) superfamily protein YafD